jgi:hypothetical protein
LGVSGKFRTAPIGGIGGISNLSRYRNNNESVKVNRKRTLEIVDNRNAVDKGWWAMEGKTDHCGK